LNPAGKQVNSWFVRQKYASRISKNRLEHAKKKSTIQVLGRRGVIL
jgi:uncharacterized protein YidB (DUF937 family)